MTQLSAASDTLLPDRPWARFTLGAGTVTVSWVITILILSFRLDRLSWKRVPWSVRRFCKLVLDIRTRYWWQTIAKFCGLELQDISKSNLTLLVLIYQKLYPICSQFSILLGRQWALKLTLPLWRLTVTGLRAFRLRIWPLWICEQSIRSCLLERFQVCWSR